MANNTAETRMLLSLLARSLSGAQGKEAISVPGNRSYDWDGLVEMARRHGVLPLIYEELCRMPVPEQALGRARQLAQVTVRQNYRLLLLSRSLLDAFEERQIPVVLLKGMGTASFYQVPELRKSGDVDLLLLDEGRLEEARKCLEEVGCGLEEWQPSLHHIVYSVDAAAAQDRTKKIEIELHTMLAEPFDDERVNGLLRAQVPACAGHIVKACVAGVELPVLDTAYHAYELLLHMLQHFLRSGFGLKLLCDWVVFWNRDTDPGQQRLYLELVEECGVKKFSDLVSLTCVKYLGLPKERIAFMAPDRSLSPEDFLNEILEAEEFGKSSKDRMVALRGNGVWDYVREFHHQMHLNYPKAGRCFLLWPCLWGITLVRFLVNNRRIRKTSLSAILKKAGQRGKIMKKLNLFTKHDNRKL